jgi:hypothetical protein
MYIRKYLNVFNIEYEFTKKNENIWWYQEIYLTLQI